MLHMQFGPGLESHLQTGDQINGRQ